MPHAEKHELSPLASLFLLIGERDSRKKLLIRTSKFV